MMHADHSRSLYKTLAIPGVCVLLLGVQLARAQSSPRDICMAPSGQKEYVNQSLSFVQQGQPKMEVLEALHCIWRNQALKSEVRMGAFRALVHIVRDDHPTLRKYMLAGIQETSDTDIPCDPQACEVLMFVADVTSRKVLLAEVKKHWDTKCAEGFLALRELGDEGIIAWMEERMEAVPADERDRLWFAESLRFAKSLRSWEGILAYLRTDRVGVGDGEVIQQAVRHGATRDDLRRYYCERIAEYDGTTKRSRLRARRYAAAARDRGVFDKSDIEKLPEELKVHPDRFVDDVEYYWWPGWATGVDQMRREFWGPYLLDGKEK